MFYRNTILLLTSFFSTVGMTYAQNTKQVNVVTTAVPFLRIAPDASANGMGNMGIATPAEANAVFWNPGKIPFAQKTSALVVNYSPWLAKWADDMYMASMGVYYKFGENEAIHGSLRYFDPGNLQFTDNNGSYLESVNPSEFDIEAGYSRKLSDKIGLGLTIKYIHSNIASSGADGSDYKAGNAVAGDLGFYFDSKNATGSGWAFGAALSNLGTKISYSNNAGERDFIPANLGLGTSYTKAFDEKNTLSVGLEINKLLVPTPPESGNTAALNSYRNKSVAGSWFSSFGDAPGGFSEELKEFQVSIGAQYWLNNFVAFRGGFFYENKSKGARNYFSTGIGIRYNLFTVNLAYLAQSSKNVSQHPLSNTLQFGLNIDLKD